MEHYTVQQLSKMAGVSVRTLHYYDEIGLLAPAGRSAAGYRVYGKPELLRLQQILFYRELDLPLEEIRRIMSNPRFSKAKALREHRAWLQTEIQRLQRLTRTIDKTLQHIKGEKTMLTDEELYEGFPAEKAERYGREARQLYGEKVVEQTEKRIRKMSKEQWAAVRQEGGAVAQELAKVSDKVPSDPAVQALIRRHHAWIENFYTAPAERYRGLGLMYTENPEFRAFYDQYRPGLADFMRKAMEYFCDHELAERK
jgi:DNA-binding transcriptional MerR regulator